MKTYNIPPIDDFFNYISIDKSPNTIRSYVFAVDKLFSFLKVTNFEDVKVITSADIRNHQAFLKSTIEASTVNSYVRPLKVLFNWLVNGEYLEKSPMEKVKFLKEPKKLLAFLSDDEQKAMIEACEKDQDRLIIAVLISTGLRREELATLTLENYNGTHITVVGKGNKERKLVLQPAVIELMNKYITERNAKYGNSGIKELFISQKGCHYSGDGVYKKVKAILKKAGLPEDRVEAIHTHSLRHTFCSNFLEVANLAQVQKSMGHANVSTTMRYIHIREEALDRAMLNQKSIL